VRRSAAREAEPAEPVRLRVRPHARALVLPVLVLLGVLAAAGFGAGRLPEGRWQEPGRWAVAVLALALLVRASLLPWLRWLTTALVVTDRRVVVERGVLRRTSRGVPLSRVADVGIERSALQRLLGSGTLVLDTVGERGGVVVTDVPRVREVAAQVEALLDDVALDRD
jgi:membrane protein YdbS with pleckstrin-like domain